MDGKPILFVLRNHDDSCYFGTSGCWTGGKAEHLRIPFAVWGMLWCMGKNRQWPACLQLEKSWRTGIPPPQVFQISFQMALASVWPSLISKLNLLEKKKKKRLFLLLGQFSAVLSHWINLPWAVVSAKTRETGRTKRGICQIGSAFLISCAPPRRI